MAWGLAPAGLAPWALASALVATPVTPEITDHCDRAIARLASWYRNHPKREGSLCAFVDPIQDLEQVCAELLEGRHLDTAIGMQLDAIGSIVGLDRDGLPDETYRVTLRAWCAACAGRGSADEIRRITQLVLDGSAVAHLRPAYPAGIEIDAGELPAPTAFRALKILRAIVDAGVSLTVYHRPDGPVFGWAESVPPAGITAVGWAESTPLSGRWARATGLDTTVTL